MASDEPQPQLPGLRDPATTGRRSDAAAMVTGGAGDGELVMGAKGPLDGVVLIGMPCGQVLLAPTPLSSMKQVEEVSAPAPPCPAEKMIPAAAAKGEKQKQCLQCGATETPQWRFQPIGLGALCNACRIRLRPAEALREKVHVPPPETAATTVITESPVDGWISKAWMEFDAYLLTVAPPRREKSPSPAPAPEKKQKRKRMPWHPRKSPLKRCDHCNSASTPQWRTGPAGPSVLCNACGVRYRNGHLRQEYRPAASPNFKPSKLACEHREVVQLRQQKNPWGKEQQQPPESGAGDGGGGELPMGRPISLDQLLLDAIDGSRETHIVYSVGDVLQMADTSSLDEFLFNGPAAPPLIDDDGEDLVD